jgi:hypothetical protein
MRKHYHRLNTSTSPSHLFAPSTLERIRLRLLLPRRQRIEQVLLLDLLVLRLALLARHVLRAHRRQLGCGEVTGDDGLPQTRVGFVFEVHHEGADARFVGARGGGAPVGLEDGEFESVGSFFDEVGC